MPPKQQYAHATTTTKTATLAELEKVLTKYGCTTFIAGTQEGDATIAFQVHALNILMRLPLPKITENRFQYTPSGRGRDDTAIFNEWQAAVRATWRALLLFVKAKLVGVDQGLTTIEQEFLPYILLPGGGTFGDTVIPQIREAYDTGQVPPLLPPTTRPAIGS